MRTLNLTPPKDAMLDADILLHKAAFKAESREAPEYLESNLMDLVWNYVPSCVVRAGGRITLALSCSRADNYRKDFLPSYKEHRNKKPSPQYLPRAKEILLRLAEENNWAIAFEERLEADDLMGRAASGNTHVAVTIDKDLRTVPGWHWNPDKEFQPVFVSRTEADRFFHQQWLTGDMTDNIPGLYRVGPKKAQALLHKVAYPNWSMAVMAEYQNRDLTEETCMSMAHCIRILQHGETPGSWSPWS